MRDVRARLARRLLLLAVGAMAALLPAPHPAPQAPAEPDATPVVTPQPTPEETSTDPLTEAPTDGCRRDPAPVPPPPARPDGRRSNYLHTCGNRIYDSHGQEVRLTGIAWSGMELGGYAPGGLTHRSWQDVLDQIAALGYNTIRLPFSTEALEPGRRIANVDYRLNPDLEGLSPLEVMDRIVAGARERGLKIVLDRHFVAAERWTTLWYTRDVPEARWIADWRMLAARYYGDDTVVAVDLHNEPHGEATWGSGDPATDWRLAAERAGNAVLEVNPYLLVFVEGVEHSTSGANWWGGNLEGARAAPVRLAVPNRLVYSPHDYGPSVYDQAWFWEPSFPANLPGRWDRFWGYLHQEGTAPVVVGEFGGPSVGDDRDGLWQRTLLEYLRAHGMGFIVWSLNPNWDTGGILAGDWRTLQRVRHEAYRAVLAPPIDHGPLGAFGRAPGRLILRYRQHPAGSDGAVGFSVQVLNDGPTPVPLHRLEARYWLADEAPSATAGPVEVRTPDGAPFPATAEIAPGGDGQPPFVRVRFDERAGDVPPYATSAEVVVRLQRGHDAAALPRDYSYAALSALHQRLHPWDRATLYLDGNLAWGREP